MQLNVSFLFETTITKMLHEELNQTRIAQKKAAESLKIKERAKLFNSLKGSKYTLYY